MKRKKRAEFRPEAFLTETGDGRTLTTMYKDKVVFVQGDPANAIFYIRKGKVKLTVISKTGKEAMIAVMGSGDFFGEGCLARGNHSARRRQPPSRTARSRASKEAP